ncbi:MAG: REP-associated tyrosine transposase [Candidatus Acidiferrales bacterium]
MEAELKNIPAEKQDAEKRKRLEAWIDAGHGSCLLRQPEIAAMVQETLLIFDSQRYRLLAWVVMPNYVHALFAPMHGWTVAKIVASWKKFTARKICDTRRPTRLDSASPQPDGRVSLTAPVWHREYWDRYIRDQRHLDQVISYIHSNPVEAGLVASAEIWPWSSAYRGPASSASQAANPGTANLRIGGVRK